MLPPSTMTMNGLIELIYSLALLATLAFSLIQLSMLVMYVFRPRRQQIVPVAPVAGPALPRLTVQLPVFNEVYVIERLIDAVMQLRYPPDKLDIQILDDSTDETTTRIARKLTAYAHTRVTIAHIRRPNRTGYKAGALAYGLPLAKGEFIAIFDADFIPEPDFLLRAIAHFNRPDIGVVQTRWLHLNENYSLLTQLQAMGLNAHFVVEQNARYAGKLFLNFNGTAGIWRKKAILDAGGWQIDTLTEDLDLSYRAQLKGWQISYRDDIGVRAELPVTMNAIKSQQYRWMKGPAECAQKLLGQVLSTPDVSLGKKIHACFHLLNSSLFVVILVMSLLSLPVLYSHQSGHWRMTEALQSLFMLASVVSLLFWGIPFFQLEWARYRSTAASEPGRRWVGWFRFIWLYPLFLAVMLGLSLHNSLAVLEGHLGIKTPFVRTPKFNVASQTNAWETNVYVRQAAVPWLVWLELGLAFYFALGVSLGVYWHDYTMLSFHALLTVGFGLVTFYSLSHAYSIRQAEVEPRVVPAV